MEIQVGSTTIRLDDDIASSVAYYLGLGDLGEVHNILSIYDPKLSKEQMDAIADAFSDEDIEKAREEFIRLRGIPPMDE